MRRKARCCSYVGASNTESFVREDKYIRVHICWCALSQKQRIFPRNTSECIWEQVPWPVNFRRWFNPSPFGNFLKHFTLLLSKISEKSREEKNLCNSRIRFTVLPISKASPWPLHYGSSWKINHFLLANYKFHLVQNSLLGVLHLALTGSVPGVLIKFPYN